LLCYGRELAKPDYTFMIMYNEEERVYSGIPGMVRDIK
jgi:hypothetical protein